MNIIELAKEAHYNSKTWIDIYKDDITSVEICGYLEAFAALITAQLMSEIASICAEHKWVDLTDDEILLSLGVIDRFEYFENELNDAIEDSRAVIAAFKEKQK